MKFSFTNLLKFYFIAFGIVVGLGVIVLFILIPQRNQSQRTLMQHPYVLQQEQDGYKVIKSCGSYKRNWSHELTSICLEKFVADSGGGPGKILRQVVQHETGPRNGCEFSALTPTDSLCLVQP